MHMCTDMYRNPCKECLVIDYIRECKKILLDGGGGGWLTVWVAQPTYRRVWGHASLGNIFEVYALKSILVQSEKKKHY